MTMTFEVFVKFEYYNVKWLKDHNRVGVFDRFKCCYMLNIITSQFAPWETYLTRFIRLSRRFLNDFHNFENIIFNLENFKSLKEIKILHF